MDAHTQDAFDGFFSSVIPRYHDNNAFIPVVCLVYHSGQVEYVPGIIGRHSPRHVFLLYFELFEPLQDLIHGIQFSNINLRDIGTDNDRYRQCLLGFLQDPARSGKYAIGPHKYTKATLFFMKQISRLYPESEGWEPLEEEESFIASKITFHDNIWTLDTSGSLFDVKTFLFLGYIIFFLPKCAKSTRLLEYCEQQSFLGRYIIKAYPEQTALVRQAMRDYLERVGSEFPLECGEDWDD